MSAYEIRVDIKLHPGGGGEGAFTCWWKRLLLTLTSLSGDVSEEIHEDLNDALPEPRVRINPSRA